MLVYILEAFIVASISWMYHSVLRAFLLSDWFLFGFKHFGQHEGTWREYIYKPIWGCELCFSGQFAFWIFFNLYDSYSPFFHLGFIAISILFTKLIYGTTNYD